MTVRFNQLVKTIRDAYADFEFWQSTTRPTVNFINVDLSAFYLTSLKTLHWRCQITRTPRRRQMEYRLFSMIFLWNHQTLDTNPSSHCGRNLVISWVWSWRLCSIVRIAEAETLIKKKSWIHGYDLHGFRGQAQKALEEARNAKVIGKSLEAHLTVYPKWSGENSSWSSGQQCGSTFDRVWIDHRRRTSSEGAVSLKT